MPPPWVLSAVSGSLSGMWSVKVAPAPGALSAVMVPPCASAISRAIARPSPLPPDARERDLSARQNRSKR